MRNLLHIVATPREELSRTLKVSSAFLAGNQDWDVDELNLFTEELPELTYKNIDGKYQLLSGKDLSPATQKLWREILDHIGRFKNADGYLLSAPMWNFSVPYVLKQYIDLIVQPRYLFQYALDGKVEGLIRDKKMLVITSRGGDYAAKEAKALDLQEPYLRTIFNLVGIANLRFIHAQPMDMGEELQKNKIAAAQQEAKDAVIWFNS
jgi:FMN-dependent NADH-azoreductase